MTVCTERHIPDVSNACSNRLFAHVDAGVPTSKALWLMSELCLTEPGQTTTESDHRAGLIRYVDDAGTTLLVLQTQEVAEGHGMIR